jgi:hypothetical protein
MSNQSRFDQYELISGVAGHYFWTECIRNIDRKSIDIRTADTISAGLLDGTKALFLLGEKAFKDWTIGYQDYSLNEQRGSPLENRWNLPCIASYLPQDAMDIVDYEKKLNPLADHETEEYETDEDETEYETKRKGKTKRSNYRFWLKRDTEKLDILIRSKKTSYTYGSRQIREEDFILAPSSQEIINFLRNTTSQFLYLDIETSVDGGYNMWCIGLATDTSPIYVIPIFRYNGSLFYSNTHSILAALGTAFRRNTVVCHNGFAFDLFILCWRYGVPFYWNNYDTMIAFHRMFPHADKTLGHLMSTLTWEPYHKDEGIFAPVDIIQERKLWTYNAKDVAGMRLCKWAIDEYAKKIPGLPESINQGNACIYPYLLCSLVGILFDDEARNSIVDSNDKLMNQLLRLTNIATKEVGYKETLLPNSSMSCVKFFHDYLNYDVISRSQRISKKTGRPLNTPSLNEKALWKLKLKYPDNLLIDIAIKYRQTKKETSMLMFNPWNFYELPR